jgi:hypothetical protein
MPLGSLQRELDRTLTALPGLTRRASRWSDTSETPAYHCGDREIAHFHKDGRLDVRLTREVIREHRREGTLDPRIRTRGPSADWVGLPLSSETDLPLAVELVEEAIRANA